MDGPDPHAITATARLWELVGDPPPRVLAKDGPALDQRARDFMAGSPLLVMATTGEDGSCDAGPKGGPPGFVRALSDTRLLVPEFPGNRRFDGVQNIVDRPGIAEEEQRDEADVRRQAEAPYVPDVLYGEAPVRES